VQKAVLAKELRLYPEVLAWTGTVGLTFREIRRALGLALELVAAHLAFAETPQLIVRSPTASLAPVSQHELKTTKV